MRSDNRLVPAGAVGLLAAAALSALPAAAQPVGDAERGAELWSHCAACHMIGEDAVHRIGPQLNDVFNRPAGTIEGFNYSPELVQAGVDGLVWNEESLSIFLENPARLIPRVRMGLPGLRNDQERLDVIAFLRSYTDFGDGSGDRLAGAQSTDPEAPAELLATAGDPAYGEFLASECLACHKADGANDGIPSIVGWPEADFMTALYAYKVEARENPVMQVVARSLGDAEIASLAVYFAAAGQ